MNKLDIPAIKKRCEADPTVVFIGDEVLLLVEALEEAKGKLDAVEELRDNLKKLLPREGTVNYETLRQLARILEGASTAPAW